MRGRAIARPSCVYTVITAGGIVDNDAIFEVDDNGEFDYFHFFFFENLIFNCHFGLELRILKPHF